ncbi:FUSC family protein [Micromonospora sp. NPDC000018]|uniref:FUSC family protein n=1 Tax=Micromonospora sp. NPDC000018 TaxID=3154239 RepID=UPI003316FB88
MAADRDGQPHSDGVSGLAKDFATRARREGGEAGRLRLRQLEIILLISVQAGLAASLSWTIAHEVLDRPAPVFAPSAAVGLIVAALGQRARRTFELVFGVGLGLLLSDLLLFAFGFGPWQIGLVVALAIAVALLLTGRSGALVAQAGSAAVLIATLSPAERDLEWSRVTDSVVGGVVGLLVVALLLPINPMRVVDRAAEPVIEALSSQLQEVGRALRRCEPNRAVGALEQLRSLDSDLARLQEAVSGAEEVAVIAPVRWRRRGDVERYQHGVSHLGRVVLESRELARWVANSLQYNERVPEELAAAVERLADAVRLLREESLKGRSFERSFRAILDAAYLAGRARERGLTDAIAIQTGTIASDMIRSTGVEADRANQLVRDAMNQSHRG